MDIQDINSLYTQTDLVFSDCGLDLSTETKELQRLVTADDSGVALQFARKQHMMYSFEQTSQSVWMLSNHIHRQFEREEFDAFDDPETTHAAKFLVMCRLAGGGYAPLKQRIVTRRFMEEDRMVLVWKSVIAGEGSLSGIQTDETGWAIIRPSPTGLGTMMQVCMKHVPLHLNEPRTISEAVMSQYNNLLEHVIRENDREITTGAEALLLEDALTGINQLQRRIAKQRRIFRNRQDQ